MAAIIVLASAAKVVDVRDTADLRLRLASMTTHDRCSLRFPPGKHTLSSPLVLSAGNVSIIGSQSSDRSVLDAEGLSRVLHVNGSARLDLEEVPGASVPTGWPTRIGCTRHRA